MFVNVVLTEDLREDWTCPTEPPLKIKSLLFNSVDDLCHKQCLHDELFGERKSIKNRYSSLTE